MAFDNRRRVEIAQLLAQLSKEIHPNHILDAGDIDPRVHDLRVEHAPLSEPEAMLVLRYIDAGDAEDVAIARMKVTRIPAARDAEPLGKYYATLADAGFTLTDDGNVIADHIEHELDDDNEGVLL